MQVENRSTVGGGGGGEGRLTTFTWVTGIKSTHLQRKGRYQQTGNSDAPKKIIHFPLLNYV